MTKQTTITVMNQSLRVEYTGFGDSLQIAGVNDIEDIESFFGVDAFHSIYQEMYVESLREHFAEMYWIAEAKGDEVSRSN